MSQWYYMHDGEAVGPVSLEKVQELVALGLIVHSTPLKEETGEWTTAEDAVSELFNPTADSIESDAGLEDLATAMQERTVDGSGSDAGPELFKPKASEFPRRRFEPRHVVISLAVVVVVVVVIVSAVMVEAMKDKPGKVVITVTWKYNDYVGNKPDTGSVVVLVPVNLNGKLPGAVGLGSDLLYLDVSMGKGFADKGAYLEIVGGDGKATFNQVKPKTYMAVVISKNTRESPARSKLNEAKLERLFEEPDVYLHKVKMFEIKVAPGQPFEKSYDFGLTYF